VFGLVLFGLPERTANKATYLMMGRIPVVGELHKRILKTFGNIIRKDKFPRLLKKIF
jgi:hypothetical protein